MAAPAQPVTPATAPAAAPTPAPQITPAQVGADTPVPQYNNGAAMAAIKQFYSIPDSTAGVVGQQKANAFNAQTTYENSVKNQQLQAQHLQDKLDPSKYNVQNTPQGVKITDPTGKPIDIGSYVNLTGENPAKLLANSTNPKDQQFVQDYTNYQTLMQAIVTKDKNQESNAVYQSYIKANPALANMTPEQVRTQFMGQYGKYFGAPQTIAASPSSAQYTPEVNPSTSQYLYERQLVNPGSPINTAQGAQQEFMTILEQARQQQGQ